MGVTERRAVVALLLLFGLLAASVDAPAAAARQGFAAGRSATPRRRAQADAAAADDGAALSVLYVAAGGAGLASPSFGGAGWGWVFGAPPNVTCHDAACAHSLCNGGAAHCVRVVPSAEGRGYVVQDDYRACQEHTTGLFGPSFFLLPVAPRVALLGALLLFLFVGLAVVADALMVSIEVITSKKKTLTFLDDASGEKITRTVQLWHPTVTNLTLLALGSSAPEICLALINTLSTLDADQPGQLGAATIVGSASFNLLVVTAVCIVAPPPGELRRVSSIRVFLCTASASVLAFVSPATTPCLDQRAVV